MSVCSQSEASTVPTTSTPTLSMSVDPLVISTRVFAISVCIVLLAGSAKRYELYTVSQCCFSSVNISVLVLYYSGRIFFRVLYSFGRAV